MELLRLVPYTHLYLDKSYEWFQNEELLKLIDGSPLSKVDQYRWYKSIKNNETYHIWGVEYRTLPIGACGLKHIAEGSGELFCYIGEPTLWGGELVEV